MKTAKLFGVLVILLFVIISVSATAPQTIVVGKIYDQSYGTSGLGGVDIRINCDGTIRDKTSEPNGDFGVSFDKIDCKNGSTMTVTTSKSEYNTNNWENTSGGILTITQGDNELLIVNFVMTLKTSSPTPNDGRNRGGSGGCNPTFWDCSDEWSECIDGLQTKRCTSNCGTHKTETQSCNTEENSQENLLELEEPETIEEDEAATTDKGFLSLLTGAVIGGGAATWGTAGAFIVLILGSFAVVRIRRKRKLKK